jgi:hypothetical protein
MAMAGLREVLVYAENEGKVVTVTANEVVVTGTVRRVNPLVLEPSDGSDMTVIDFESIQAVAVKGATAEELVAACKPQTEARFTGTRNL